MLIKLIIEIVIGAVCGYIANGIMKGDQSSILKNLILAQRQALDFILGGRNKG